MRLDNISVALRPRSVWEAIDLGFGMSRLWWGPLLKSWLFLALPMFLILNVALYQYPLWAGLLFWWLKPAYEQLPLIYLSRSLFRQDLTSRQLLHALPASAARQLLANLTWRRFSPVRSFSAPVAQLEGLSGRQRQLRLQVLQNAYSGSGWLTVVGVHLEGILYFSILLLTWFVLPEQIEVIEWLDKNPTLAEIGGNTAYFCAAAIIAPFYVGSGFSLYLNRRAQLEGWDIELVFRQMQARLGERRPLNTTAASLLIAILALGWHIPDAGAEEQTEVKNPAVAELTKAKALIDEVLSSEDFGKKETVKIWRFKDELKPDDSEPASINLNFLKLLGQIGEYLLWLLVAVFIILILYNLPRWRASLRKPSLRKPSAEPPPQALFGLDIREDSLPEDIALEAWRLFQAQQVRNAMSLLYRGTLAVLVNHHGVALKQSHTEGECAQQVSQSQPDTIADYFSRLTVIWINMAYGHQIPTAQMVQELCDNWQTHFGDSSQ